jgi:hypothetical protein
MLILFRKSKVKKAIVDNVNLIQKNKDKEIMVETYSEKVKLKNNHQQC